MIVECRMILHATYLHTYALMKSCLGFYHSTALLQDYGDGGAFPEIHMAQYPLNMGLEKKESSSNALAVQLDAEGKIKYDVIARQGHSKDKVNLFLKNFFLHLIFEKRFVFIILCDF